MNYPNFIKKGDTIGVIAPSNSIDSDDKEYQWLIENSYKYGYILRYPENKEKITYIDEDLKEILKETNGIIIYQEQIMQIARTMADYTLGEADILRKAMSKKKLDLLLQEEKRFKALRDRSAA